MNDSPKQFCHVAYFAIHSHYAISQGCMSVFHVSFDQLYAAFLYPCKTLLSFRRSVFGAALVILLDHIVRYRHDIVVALVDLLITLRYS